MSEGEGMHVPQDVRADLNARQAADDGARSSPFGEAAADAVEEDAATNSANMAQHSRMRAGMEETQQVRMRAGVQEMIASIKYAYGVDLGGDAGAEARRRHNAELTSTSTCIKLGARSEKLGINMEQVATALSDGVALCKLATCLQQASHSRSSSMPLTPTSSNLRGWTLTPKNRSQRLNNLRIALEVLRNDRSIQMRGHATHSSLFQVELLESGDVESARCIIAILYTF